MSNSTLSTVTLPALVLTIAGCTLILHPFKQGDSGDFHADGSVDGEVENGVDSDVDGDGDGDGDGDVDGDADSDTDSDRETCRPDCGERECGSDGCSGLCPPGCEDRGTVCVERTGQCESDPCALNSIQGAPCEGVNNCDDGSFCFPMNDYGRGVCAEQCVGPYQDVCTDVSPIGNERCGLSYYGQYYCGFHCSTSEECPCGMRCTDELGACCVCMP